MDNTTQSDELCPIAQQWSLEVRYFGLGVFLFQWISLVAAILVWYVQKDHVILRKRQFGLAILFGIGGLPTSVSYGLVAYIGEDVMPCDLNLLLSVLGVPICCGITISRLVLFYNKHRYAQLFLKESNFSSNANQVQTKAILSTEGSLFFKRASRWSQIKAFWKWSTRCKIQKTQYVYRNNGSDTPRSQSVASETDSQERFMKYAALSLMSNEIKYPFLIITVYTILGLINFVQVYFTKDEYRGGCFGCRLEGTDILMKIFLLSITMSSIIRTLYHLRDVPDPFKIKYELKMMCTIAILLVVAQLSATLNIGNVISEQDRTIPGIFSWHILSTFFGHLISLFQLGYPIFLIYSTNINHDDSEYNASLNEILETPSSYSAFKMYLATEFSIENLIFYEFARAYQDNFKSFSEEDARRAAESIIDSFIEPGSDLEINISALVRNQILKESEDALTPNLFDGAMGQVLKLLQDDSLPRFLKSDFGSSLLVRVVDKKKNELSTPV